MKDLINWLKGSAKRPASQNEARQNFAEEFVKHVARVRSRLTDLESRHVRTWPSTWECSNPLESLGLPPVEGSERVKSPKKTLLTSLDAQVQTVSTELKSLNTLIRTYMQHCVSFMSSELVQCTNYLEEADPAIDTLRTRLSSNDNISLTLMEKFCTNLIRLSPWFPHRAQQLYLQTMFLLAYMPCIGSKTESCSKTSILKNIADSSTHIFSLPLFLQVMLGSSRASPLLRTLIFDLESIQNDVLLRNLFFNALHILSYTLRSMALYRKLFPSEFNSYYDSLVLIISQSNVVPLLIMAAGNELHFDLATKYAGHTLLLQVLDLAGLPQHVHFLQAWSTFLQSAHYQQLLSCEGELNQSESLRTFFFVVSDARFTRVCEKVRVSAYLPDNVSVDFALLRFLLCTSIHALGLIHDEFVPRCLQMFLNSPRCLTAVINTFLNSTPGIQLDAFHLVKLFIVNPRKSSDIEMLLKQHRNEILLVLSSMRSIPHLYASDRKDQKPEDATFLHKPLVILQIWKTLMHFKPLQILPCTPPSRETILVDAIFDEVTETKLHIFLSIGQLLHVASESREVNLPFLTKTLISLTRRGDVHFQEELPSCVFNLMTDYIYKSYTVHDRRSQKMVEISKPGHTNIVELRELIGNEKENGSAFQTSVISRYETMREYVLYIPDSSLHLKISICRAYSRSSPDESLVSAREVDWNTYGATKKDSPLVAREILMFVERSQSFVPSQDIPTVETIEKAATLTSPLSNSECPEQHQNSAALLEKVESTKGWRICPNLALLQVYLKQHKRKQLTSMVAHLIQCGLQVTTVLFEHSRQLTILSTTAVTKDIAKCTQQHYDRKKVFSARESAIRNLREYNNLVKQGIYAAHIKKGTEAVLDLACGHGQDMPKFLGLEIRHFVGVDISEQEILEAKRRSGSLKFQNMKISLYSGNILHESTYLQLPISLYNAVTVQLAIHYCVENEATADFMLGTISNHLKDDGYFLGSTGCSDVIAKRLTDAYLHPDDHTMDYDLLENPDVSFGNSVYRVGFSRSLVERLLANADDTSATDDLNRNEVLFRLNKTLSSQWGIQYHFFLVDHIDAPEYVVPWTSFVQMAAKHNLRLLYDETFDRAFDDLDQVKDTAVRNRLFKLRRMELSTSENEVFSFYKIFVFKKSKIPIDPAEKEDLLFSPHSADQNSSERTNFHSKAQGGCNSQKRSMNKHFAPDNPYPKFKRTASQFRGGRGRPSNKKFYGNNGLVTPASHRYHPKGNSYRVFQDYSEEKNRFQKASDYQRPTEKFDEVEIKFPSETEPSSEDPLNFEARPIYIKGSETPEFLASPHMFAMDEALSSERGSISSTSSSHDSPLSQVLEKAA